LIAKLSSFQSLKVSEKFSDRSRSEIKLPADYHEKLVERRYSPATVKNYESRLVSFLKFIAPAKATDITVELIRKYLYHLADDRRVSTSTQNQAINAIKFYLEQVLGGERKTYYIDRPFKEQQLPRVLSVDEVKLMIELTLNMKHRFMLVMLYSSGLRLSELLGLRWQDFDDSRLQLFVKAGKGRKDRYTVLSTNANELAKRYQMKYSTRDFVFEGPNGSKYSARSVGKIVSRAARRAGISKGVTPHTLRHSFATHLLEQGVNLRYIQELLGRESSRTTERYTHMTSKGLSGIRSPLDCSGIDVNPLSSGKP
jgi:site-specific recombinase XerD